MNDKPIGSNGVNANKLESEVLNLREKVEALTHENAQLAHKLADVSNECDYYRKLVIASLPPPDPITPEELDKEMAEALANPIGIQDIIDELTREIEASEGR